MSGIVQSGAGCTFLSNSSLADIFLESRRLAEYFCRKQEVVALDRILQLLLLLLALSAYVLICLPLALFGLKGFGAINVAVTAFFVLFAVEKTWSMLIRMRRFRESPRRDWTTVTVGYSFTAVLYVSLLDYYLRSSGIASRSVMLAGVVVTALAVAGRYWAFRHLGHQWAVHVDLEIKNRALIMSGPYRWVRHPLYVGAIMEAIGIPLLFNSVVGLLLAVLVFVPLEVHRAYFEERFLRRIFGQEYDRYAARTWAFFPLTRVRRSVSVPDSGDGVKMI